jgi:hypothetical protein
LLPLPLRRGGALAVPALFAPTPASGKRYIEFFTANAHFSDRGRLFQSDRGR